MRCKRCNCWIYKGYEVLYKNAYYHDFCAVQQAKEDKQPVVAKPKLRLIIGGKK